MLLVEDEPINREIALSVLDDVGQRVDVAVDGLVAIEMIERMEYDLVLMDWRMPGMDGLQTVEILKSHSETAGIPVVMLTARVDGDEPPGWRRLFSTIGLLHLQTPLELVEGAYRDVRIFAGYAGWGPGQLEGELAGDLWYPVRGTYSDVFDADPESLWRRILRRQPGELGWLATWTSTPELN